MILTAEEQEAIRLLESRGFVVSIDRTVACFPCKYGHNHKTEQARSRCEVLASRCTGLGKEGYYDAMRKESRPKYIEAYAMYDKGARKSEVARHFKVSSSRAAQMISQGYRYALEDGNAGRDPYQQ